MEVIEVGGVDLAVDEEEVTVVVEVDSVIVVVAEVVAVVSILITRILYTVRNCRVVVLKI